MVIGSNNEISDFYNASFTITQPTLQRLSYFGGNLQIVSKLHLGTEVTITAPSRLRSQSSGEAFEPKSYSGR